MKVLVTGATGLVGNALVKKLVENGHTVHILTRKKQTDPIIFIGILRIMKSTKRLFTA